MQQCHVLRIDIGEGAGQIAGGRLEASHPLKCELSLLLGSAKFILVEYQGSP